MSHYIVTVLVTASRLKSHKGNVDEALTEMLLPYEESTEDERFLKFKDVEDEYRPKYESDTTTRIFHNGKNVTETAYNRFGNGPFPPGYDKKEVPLSEVYASFDEYCDKYCGFADRHPETSKIGYWHNPNAKWDWWAIGGRWTGYFPVKSTVKIKLGKPGAFNNQPKPGRADIIKRSDIDMDVVARETREAAEKFFDEYQELLNGKKFDVFDGPRHKAIDLGLLRVEEKTVSPGPNEVVFPWSEMNVDPKRRDWSDVATVIKDKDAFLSEYIDCFCPIISYAALDETGWYAPGEMGWWGVSSDTSAEYIRFCKEFFRRFITAANDDDVIVAVDCHI